MGGYHPTYSPEAINEQVLDAICLGEPDNLIPEFCKSFGSGLSNLKIPSFYFKLNGEIVKNELASLVYGLDTSPFADRSIYYDYYPSLAALDTKSFFLIEAVPIDVLIATTRLK
jgi:hypothetical protein